MYHFMVAQADEFLVYNPTNRGGTAHCVREIRRAEKPYTNIHKTGD